MMKYGLSGKDKARERALKKLSVRDRTEKEILDFLKEEGCSGEEAAEITAEFREWGYIDDEKYCRSYFKYGKSKGKASARIVRELAGKGISAEKAGDVIEELTHHVDDRETALSVGMKMAFNQAESGKPLDEKFLARVGRRLAGLGYDSGTCWFVIDKVRNYGKKREKEDE